MGAALGDRRLERTAGGRHRIAVERDQIHSQPLEELQRPQVVVGRDQPQTGAAGVDGRTTDRVEERPSDAAALPEAADRDQLARVAAHGVGREADGLAVEQGDEAGQHRRVDELAEAGDDRRRPAVGLDPCGPGPVGVGQRPDVQHRAIFAPDVVRCRT
ncbi:MAG TPA: hypothetical protein VLV46_08435 [Gaiellaceae bacterium]|nr:hypothetical protein [Gaiellaceae bacterium]